MAGGGGGGGGESVSYTVFWFKFEMINSFNITGINCTLVVCVPCVEIACNWGHISSPVGAKSLIVNSPCGQKKTLERMILGEVRFVY